jgi:hypothetical protein
MNAIKSRKWGLVLLLLAMAGIGNVWADRGGHGNVHFGVVVGPLWSPFYYPSPYYYPPYPPVVIERAPPVYIEQSTSSAPAPQATESRYWYYCRASKAYYPYVNECPGGWQRVSPRPPDQP